MIRLMAEIEKVIEEYGAWPTVLTTVKFAETRGKTGGYPPGRPVRGR